MGKFRLFPNYNKPGKGVTKEQASTGAKTTFSQFFGAYGRNFWNLSSLNLLYVVFNFPIFFGLFALTGNLSMPTTSPTNVLYAPLFGMSQISTSLATGPFFGMLGNNAKLLVPSTLTYVFFGLTALLFLTFGIANTGLTYVLRSYVRSEPVFILSDFIEAIKKNWKQAFPLGFIDLGLLLILVWDIVFWSQQSGFVNDMFYFGSILLAVLYVIMRFYLYLMMITFDLSIWKIVKNAFIFAVLGIKRNLVALLGIAVIVFLNLYLYLLIPFLGCVIPFIITVATCSYIAAYAAYPNIKKYMIDPYYKEEPKDDSNSDPIFVDRG